MQRSTGLSFRSQYSRAMPSDRQLLIRRNDEHIDGAATAADPLACRVIRTRVNMYAEPPKPLTNRGADFLRMLADAAGEDQTVQPAQRGRHHRDLLRRTEGEELDRLPRRSLTARQQRAHVGRDAGDAEQA